MYITAFAGVGYLPKATQIAEFASTLRVCQSLHARPVVPSVIRGSQDEPRPFPRRSIDTFL